MEKLNGDYSKRVKTKKFKYDNICYKATIWESLGYECPDEDECLDLDCVLYIKDNPYFKFESAKSFYIGLTKEEKKSGYNKYYIKLIIGQCAYFELNKDKSSNGCIGFVKAKSIEDVELYIQRWNDYFSQPIFGYEIEELIDPVTDKWELLDSEVNSETAEDAECEVENWFDQLKNE